MLLLLKRSCSYLSQNTSGRYRRSVFAIRGSSHVTADHRIAFNRTTGKTKTTVCCIHIQRGNLAYEPTTDFSVKQTAKENLKF